MALDDKKAKAIKKMVYDVFDRLDPTGKNTEYYKKKFESMSVSQFDTFLKGFFKDPNAYLTLSIQPYVNDTKLDDIEKAADYLGVPLFERVAMPYLNSYDDEVYWTQQKVPVMYIHMKRVEQLASKKNSMSTDITKRNPKTGQVVGDDKNGRMSDMENIAMCVIGDDNILKEFMNAKADNMYMKTEMLKQIQNDGYVDLSKIPSRASDKIALNTLDIYFTSCGVKTDLVTEGLLLSRTLQNMNKDNSSLAGRSQIRQESVEFIDETKLTAQERNKLPDSEFGIPELRKFPLIDKQHVLSAIRYFDSCEAKYKVELAKNIADRAKKFNVDISNNIEIMYYL